jgi:thioredoxin-like negative regulator of GroEL
VGEVKTMAQKDPATTYWRERFEAYRAAYARLELAVQLYLERRNQDALRKLMRVLEENRTTEKER